MSGHHPGQQPGPATSSGLGTALMSLRITIGAMLGGLGVIAMSLGFVLGHTLRDPVPWPWVGVAVLLVAAGAGLAASIGFRTAAVPPGTPPDRAAAQARGAFTTTTFLRAALCEAPAVASIGLAFVVHDGGYAIFLVGALGSALAMAFLAWPSARAMDRVGQSLSREGTPVDVPAAMSVPAQR